MQKDRPSASDLEKFVEASSRLHGYDEPNRIRSWSERLKMNGPELALMRTLEIGCSVPIRFSKYEAASISVPAGSRSIDQARNIHDGTLKPEDVLERTLGKLDDGQHLNAANFVERQPNISASGPLSGIPFAVKDLVAVSGLPLTDGSSGSRLPETDAQCVERLRKRGAYPIAMANLHELAFGITSQNIHHGDVANPRNVDRIAGGSSGGSAALVATQAVDFAIGTDTAGSIRIPAAFCGVVGFKPSFGAVPCNGVTTLAWSLDHVGPLAATVADAAVAFAAMADIDTSQPPLDLQKRRIRLVRPSNFFFDVCEPSVLSAIEIAIERIQAAGFTVETTEIEGVEQAAAAQFATLAPEAFEAHRWRLDQDLGSLSEDVRVRLEIGRFMDSVHYVRAQRYRSLLRDRMDAAMQGGRLIITPAVPIGAPEIGVRNVRVAGRDYPLHTLATRCTSPFNLTGMPAIVLPCGTDRDGLPVGLQIAAPFGDDGRLLDAAARIETILDESGLANART